MTKIFVTRHGQAEGNRDGIIMGQIDLPLTDLGREQAKLKGKELLNKNISKIYSSDLSRCLQTAQIMCQAINKPEITLQTDQRLREICFGVYQGQKYANPRGWHNESTFGRAINYYFNCLLSTKTSRNATIIVNES